MKMFKQLNDEGTTVFQVTHLEKKMLRMAAYEASFGRQN